MPYIIDIGPYSTFFHLGQSATHSANQFGTLVVYLPALHEGGDLMIRKDNQQVGQPAWHACR